MLSGISSRVLARRVLRAGQEHRAGVTVLADDQRWVMGRSLGRRWIRRAGLKGLLLMVASPGSIPNSTTHRNTPTAWARQSGHMRQTAGDFDLQADLRVPPAHTARTRDR